MDQSGSFERVFPVGATGNWALLIDGENVDSRHAEAILSHYPEAFSVRRVYGNLESLRKWPDRPELKVVNTEVGKNSADILLTIEAAKLAWSGIRDFVIVSGDGGLIHLIRHLRESGCRVVVMAQAGCKPALRLAGQHYIPLEAKAAEISKAAKTKTPANKPAPAPKSTEASLALQIERLVTATVAASQDAGVTVRCINKVARAAFPKVKDVNLSLDEWRKWLRARPKLFRLSQAGPQERARLARTATPTP